MKINIKNLIAGVMVAALAVTPAMTGVVGASSAGDFYNDRTMVMSKVSSSGDLHKPFGTDDWEASTYSIIPTGASLTIKLATQYFTNASTYEAPVGLPSETPVLWEYCSSSCGPSSSAVYSELAYAKGDTFTLTNVTSPVSLRATVLDESLLRGANEAVPAYTMVVPVGGAQQYRLYGAWAANASSTTGYVLRTVLSTNAESVDPIADRFFNQHSTDVYEVVDASQTLTQEDASSGRADGPLLPAVQLDHTYKAVSRNFMTRYGIPESETGHILVGNAAYGVDTLPSIDAAKTYSAPAFSASVISAPVAQSASGFVTLVDAPSGVSLQNRTRADVSGIKNPSGVVLKEGASFTVNGLANGGTVKVKIALANYYKDISALTVYKAGSDGKLSDISDIATFTNESGVTYLTYELTDGGKLDEDGTANGTIVDPVYVGVDSASLADTGTDTTVLIGIAFTMIGFAVVAGKKFLLANS